MSIKTITGELHLALVKSDKAHATILQVDTSVALSVPGVVGYLDPSSIPGPYKGFFIKDKVSNY